MNTRVRRRATAALLLALAACSPATDIGNILDNPRKYADQTVTVSGDVRDTFGLGALKYYTVTDRTGSIRVMTERPLPKQGEHIRVTGRVEEAFSFNIPGVSASIIGAIDLLETEESCALIITDFKTSGRSYSVDEVDRNQQLTLYQMAMKQNGHAGHEILLKFDCLIKTKSVKFESYWTTRSETDEIRMERKIPSGLVRDQQRGVH